MDELLVLASIEFDGATLENVTVRDARETGVPEAVINDAIAKARAIESRDQVRSAIARNVGDMPSLVGTVSDATGLLIAIALADFIALSSTTTFAAYRTAKLDTLKLLAGDADIAALAGGALAQIESGEAVLTASLKGLDSVITESLTRSTAVANILSQAAQADLEGE